MTTTVAMLKTVDRVEVPVSPEAFFESYIWPNKPVVLKGLIDDWDVANRWTPEYLAKVVGNKPVTIRVSDGDYDYNKNEDSNRGFEDRHMDFMSFVSQLETPERDAEKLYLHQVSLTDDFPELMSNLSLPSVVAKDLVSSILFWVSTKGNVSVLHYDMVNNLFAQVYGRKTFVLFDPYQNDYLYPSPTHQHFSQIELENPDLERFPDFPKAQCMEVTLMPGEVLYLPPFWWHQVRSVDTSISVNFFCKNFTHQWLAPINLQAIPEVYPFIVQAYEQYRPGRLPKLIDFAHYLNDVGYSTLAIVIACAALKQDLKARGNRYGFSDANPVLPNFDDAMALNRKLLGAREYPPQSAFKLEQCLKKGKQAFSKVNTQQTTDGAKALLDNISLFLKA